MTGFTSALRRLYSTSPLLTVASLLMLPALALNLVGLAVDPRLITGAPAWMKPAKFAASSAIYGLTLAWTFTYLSAWPRVVRRVGALTGVVLVGEVAIINLQAWRGTTSHFNVSTPLDAALFSIMGLAIVVQTFSTIAVAIAVWRERFADRALGVALGAGLTIAIAGALTGGLMTRPTNQQLAAMKAGDRPTVVGAHTVGAADGQAGVPITGWSTAHGDLRVPHFVGLHAFQLLPLVAIALRRRGLTSVVRGRVVTIAALSYTALFALLVVQALSGNSFFAPESGFVLAFSIWAVLTMASLAAARVVRRAAVAIV